MLIKSLALSLVAFAASATAADTIVVDSLTKNGAAFASGTAFTAQSFLTGNTNLTVSYAVFPQITPSHTDGYTSGETFAVYTDLYNLATGAHSPGAPIAGQAFSMANDAGGLTTADALAGSAPILLANTRYWFVLYTPNSSATNWNAPDINAVNYNPSQFSAASGWALATDNYSVYENSAVTGGLPTGTVTNIAYATGAQLIYVDAVPEPSTYCLMAVAGLALVVSRKRKTA